MEIVKRAIRLMHEENVFTISFSWMKIITFRMRRRMWEM